MTLQIYFFYLKVSLRKEDINQLPMNIINVLVGHMQAWLKALVKCCCTWLWLGQQEADKKYTAILLGINDMSDVYIQTSMLTVQTNLTLSHNMSIEFIGHTSSSKLINNMDHVRSNTDTLSTTFWSILYRCEDLWSICLSRNWQNCQGHPLIFW